MLDIPHNLFEIVLKNTGLKTVNQYARLICHTCDQPTFLTITEYNFQDNDISENHWKCPKCKQDCVIDFDYAHRMLAN